jgi:hypothetical protein
MSKADGLVEIVRESMAEATEEGTSRVLDIIGPTGVEDAGDAARILVTPEEGDPDVLRAYQVMVAARQFYQLARLKIRDKLEGKSGHKLQGVRLRPEITPVVEKALIDAASEQATRVFDIRALPNAAMSLMRNFASDELAAAQKRIAKKRQAEEARERADQVAIGVPMSENFAGHTHLKRGESFVIVGPRDLVDKQIREFATFTDEENSPVVLLLSSNTPEEAPLLKNSVELLKRRWSGCADNSAGTNKTIGKAMGALEVDLLVVQDLAVGCSEDHFSDVTSRIQESHRRFKSWAKEKKAAMIAGVYTDEQQEDLADDQPIWGKLGNYSQVAFVESYEDEPALRLERDVFVFETPKEETDVSSTDGERRELGGTVRPWAGWGRSGSRYVTRRACAASGGPPRASPKRTLATSLSSWPTSGLRIPRRRSRRNRMPTSTRSSRAGCPTWPA